MALDTRLVTTCEIRCQSAHTWPFAVDVVDPEFDVFFWASLQIDQPPHTQFVQVDHFEFHLMSPVSICDSVRRSCTSISRPSRLLAAFFRNPVLALFVVNCSIDQV